MNEPSHIEKHSSGVSVCRHCGGEVGDDGYSLPGMAEEEGGMMSDAEGGESEQEESGEQHRDAAFAEAIKRRGSR